MGDVTALMMDVITEKSGHSVTPLAVSVCTTPAAPSPLPIPYPVMASSVEGITDAAMRTRVDGVPLATVGSVLKTCHGNEPGTLKEVVSLNTTGPVFIIMGAPIVLVELGMCGITGSACISNKAVTVGSNGSASGAGGASGGSGGGGGGGAAPGGPGGPGGASNGGGGGGGSNSGAGGGGSSGGGRASGAASSAGSSSGPSDQHQCQGGHPVDLVTGYVVDVATDLELPGRIPLRFRRYYSSGRHRDRTATLGAGWSHAFEQSVALSRNTIDFREEQGRTIHFAAIEVGAKTFHRRERLTLHRDGELDFRIEDHARRSTLAFRPVVEGGAAVLRSITDAWSNEILFAYEGATLVRVIDTAGRSIAVSWKRGRICRLDVLVGGAVEASVEYEHDDSGHLRAAIDALGNADEFEYDTYGRMIATTIKTGARFQYTYDADSGRCDKTWGPNGLYAIEIEYDAEHRLTRVFGEEGRIIEWDDQPGLARRERTSDGSVLEERAYDADGFLIAVANGAGEGTKSWYDGRGNLVRRVDPAGGVTTWEYDARDNPMKRVDIDGCVTEYGCDDKGALTSIRERTGRHFVFSYDAKGRLVEAKDPRGVARVFEYDAQHNMIGETDARGARVAFGFDALGRAVTHTDPLDRTTQAYRDRLGRATTLRLPDGSTVERAYDARGNVVKETAPDGGTTQFTYAGMGVLTKVADPSGRVWSFTHTSEERLKKVTNPMGEAYSFAYDEGGRVVEESTFDGRTIRYQRGASGRVDRAVYADGSWRSFEYDRAGRLLEDRGSDGTSNVFRRDGAGRVIEATHADDERSHKIVYERDPTGRVVVERQGDRVLRFAWDDSDNRVERVLFDGTATRYGFDREGALASLEHAGRSFTFERDAAGREQRWSDTRSSFTMTTSYDGLDRIIEQRVRGPQEAGGIPDILVQRQYGYDRSGRANRIDDARWGSTHHAYDARGLLCQTSRADIKTAFSYDPARSLVAALDGLGSQNAKRWKLAPGDRLLETERTTYAYDKRSRRTSKRDRATGATTEYAWDVRDFLREVTLPDGTRVLMHYDALGRRVRKEVRPIASSKTIVTELVWDGDFVCADMSPERGLRSFVHHPMRPRVLVHAEQKEVFAVVSDPLGVPKELVDAAGKVAWAATHDPWGRVVGEVWDEIGAQNRGRHVRSPFRMMGQLEDEDTGLGMTRYRAFDLEVGRWLSPDPLGLRGGFNLNGFDGVPTVDVDPLGLTGPKHETAGSRNEAMQRGQEHAQVPRESKGGQTIPVGELNDSSRGRNANEIAAKGGNLGRRDPVTGASVMDHPDGHPDLTGPGQPEHHGGPHVHAVDRNGNELVISYPNPTA